MKVLTIALLLTFPLVAEARDHILVRVVGPRVSTRDLLGRSAAAIDLGAAPRPGFRRRIEAARIARLVPGAKIRARAFIVETRARQLGCATLRQRVAQSLKSTLPAGLSLMRIDCPRALTVPAAPLSIQAKLVGQRRLGAVLVRVTIRAGSWPAQKRVMSARVDGSVRVVVAMRDIVRGQPLRGVVRLATRRAAKVPSDALFALSEIDEARARSSLRKGAVLRRASLQPIPLVRRGSTVTIVVVSSGFKITNRGVARRDGARGDVVAVYCKASGRTIRARVVARQRLRVDL